MQWLLSLQISLMSVTQRLEKDEVIMARPGTRALLAKEQTTVDLELSPSSLRSSVELPLDQHQPSADQANDQEYVPLNGGYGWVCFVCVFLINAHTWGFNVVSEPLPSALIVIEQGNLDFVGFTW